MQQIPTADEILAKCKKTNVLNMRCWGSRVYGTASPTSDWDIVAVINQPDPPPSIQTNIFQITTAYEEFDDGVFNIVFIPLQCLQLELLEHRITPALQYYHCPQQFRILETAPLNFELDKSVLKRTVGWESKRRYQRAERTKNIRGDYAGKKDIVHSIRYLLFALQLIETGTLSDFTTGNEYYYSMMNEDSTMPWEDFYVKYGTIRKELSTKLQSLDFALFRGPVEFDEAVLNQLSSLYQTNNNFTKIQAPIPKDSKQNLATLKFLQGYSTIMEGLNAIKTIYGVDFVVCSSEPNLVLLAYRIIGDPLHSQEDPIKLETSEGLILDFFNWKVVAQGHFGSKHFDNETREKLQTQFDDKNWRVCQHYDGVSFILYFYNEKWQIATKWYPNQFIPGKIQVSKTPEDAIDLFYKTFWKIWESQKCEFPDPKLNNCYLLTLCGPESRMIVGYKSNFITCTGVRNMDSLQCVDFDFSATHWVKPKLFHFLSLESILREAESLNPFVSSGWKITSSDLTTSYRVTNKKYISLCYVSDLAESIGPFNLNGALDPIHARKLFFFHQVEVFLIYFPECKEILEEEIGFFKKMFGKIQEDLNGLEGSPGEVASKNWVASCHFALKRKNWCLHEFVARSSPVVFNKLLKEYQSKLQ